MPLAPLPSRTSRCDVSGRNAGQLCARRTSRCRTTSRNAAAPEAPVKRDGSPKPRHSAEGQAEPHVYPRNEIDMPISEEELQQYLKMYRSSPQERSYVIPSADVLGTIPADLHGTLYRNGPGNFAYGEDELNHPFDGDGLVWSLTFDSGSIVARRRFVRTKALLEEMKAGKMIYKGAFQVGDPSGQWQSPLDLKVRSPANTGVVDWNSSVLALHETDLPYELSDALQTVGRTEMNIWDDDDNVAAHYRIVREKDGSKRIVTFAPTGSGKPAQFRIVEFDEAGQVVAEVKRTMLDSIFGFFHDMLVTENYYVLLENPTRMDFWKLFTQYTTGKACIAECLYVDRNRPLKVHCIPRPGKAGVRRPVYETPTKFCFHHVNAFEAPGGAIVIDTIGRDHIDFGEGMRGFTAEQYHDPSVITTLRRIVCSGNETHATEHDLRQVPALRNRGLEFPAQMPPDVVARPHDVIFLGASRNTGTEGGGMIQELMRVRLSPCNGVEGDLNYSDVKVSSYYPGDRRYVGEPVFVPRASRKSQDDGYLIVCVHDLSDPDRVTNCMEILDGLDLEKGPICTIALRDFIPPGLHGSWSDRAAQLSHDEVLPASSDVRFNL